MKVGKYTIKWRYHRKTQRSKFDVYTVSSTADTRDITTCIIECPGHQTTQTATCHPSDNFSRDEGRRISLAKAMAALALTKEEKREIWEAYRTMTPSGRW
jgi:hypothetical protein